MSISFLEPFSYRLKAPALAMAKFIQHHSLIYPELVIEDLPDNQMAFMISSNQTDGNSILVYQTPGRLWFVVATSEYISSYRQLLTNLLVKVGNLNYILDFAKITCLETERKLLWPHQLLYYDTCGVHALPITYHNQKWELRQIFPVEPSELYTDNADIECLDVIRNTPMYWRTLNNW